MVEVEAEYARLPEGAKAPKARCQVTPWVHALLCGASWGSGFLFTSITRFKRLQTSGSRRFENPVCRAC